MKKIFWLTLLFPVVAFSAEVNYISSPMKVNSGFQYGIWCTDDRTEDIVVTDNHLYSWSNRRQWSEAFNITVSEAARRACQ